MDAVIDTLGMKDLRIEETRECMQDTTYRWKNSGTSFCQRMAATEGPLLHFFYFL